MKFRLLPFDLKSEWKNPLTLAVRKKLQINEVWF